MLEKNIIIDDRMELNSVDEVMSEESRSLEPLMQSEELSVENIVEANILEVPNINEKLAVENIVEANIIEVPNINEELQVHDLSSTCTNSMADSAANIVGEDAVETLEVSSATVLNIQDNLGSAELSISSWDYNVTQEFGKNRGNVCEKDQVHINPLPALLSFKGGTCNLLSKSTLGSNNMEEPTPKKGLGANSMIQVITVSELYLCTKDDKFVVSGYPIRCMVDTIKGLSILYWLPPSVVHHSSIIDYIDPGFAMCIEACNGFPVYKDTISESMLQLRESIMKGWLAHKLEDVTPLKSISYRWLIFNVMLLCNNTVLCAQSWSFIFELL